MVSKICVIGFSFLLAFIFIACSSSTKFAKDNQDNVNDGSDVSSRNIFAIQNGKASYYAAEFNGRKTANGEIYDMNDLTAAHPNFPFNTVVRVTNLSNNKSVQLRINDRMPDFKNRIIDISYAAAKKIGMIQAGVQNVKVEVLKWGDR